MHFNILKGVKVLLEFFNLGILEMLNVSLIFLIELLILVDLDD